MLCQTQSKLWQLAGYDSQQCFVSKKLPEHSSTPDMPSNHMEVKNLAYSCYYHHDMPIVHSFSNTVDPHYFVFMYFGHIISFFLFMVAFSLIRRTYTEVSLELFLAKWNSGESYYLDSLDLLSKTCRPWSSVLERH